jgi:hypothetical protein
MTALVLFFVGYTFGAIITVNGHFDHSEPETFHAKILDKHISSGKTTTYYLTLSSWGPFEENTDVTVTSDQYESFYPGNEVIVYQHPGVFRIPWYYVSN